MDIANEYVVLLDEAYVISQYIIMTFFMKPKRPQLLLLMLIDVAILLCQTNTRYLHVANTN